MDQASACSVPSDSKPSPMGTPQARKDYRKSLYKSTPSPWRETYEKRCRERMKESREKFLDRYRAISDASTEASVAGDIDSSTSPSSSGAKRIDLTVSNEAIRLSVREVMKKEWESMREEESSLPQLPSGRTSAEEYYMEQRFDDESDEMDPECVLSIMDDVTQELIKEEKAILSQYNQRLYEENLQFSESMLCAAADSMSTQTAEVVCPICQKNFLQQNLHIIFCACGLRLDTAQDCITLDFVRQQLEDCAALHSAACPGQPVFSVEITLGTYNMIMNCTHCDFMYIVI